MTQLLFAATNGSLGFEFYVTDGETVTPLGDLNPGSDDAYDFNREAAILPGGVLFRVETDERGFEPWFTDGTVEGTMLARDIFLGNNSSDPFGLRSFGDGVLFAAETFDDGFELWLSDGTEDGTNQVRDINSGQNGSDPFDYVTLGDIAVFQAFTDGDGTELWSTDGTEIGTRQVADIFDGGGSSNPTFSENDDRFVPGGNVLGDIAFFRANDGNFGEELWITDGTGDGTELVSDIFNGGDSSPSWFQAFNGNMFFSADDGTNGRELWISDGTDNGTQLFVDIFDGGDSNPEELTVIGDKLIFSARSGNEGREIWVSEGLPSNTQILANIFSGGGDSNPEFFTPIGDNIVFAATDDSIGREIFITDGTAVGTRPLLDINENGDSDPADFKVVDGMVFFSADDGEFGRELWMTDGTGEGTVRVTDIDPGSDDSDPQLLAVFDADTTPPGELPSLSDGPDVVEYTGLEQFFASAEALAEQGDSFDAGGSLDLLRLENTQRADFEETVNPDGSVTITELTSTQGEVSIQNENAVAEGSATVEGFEFITFEDGAYAYDLLADGGTSADLEYTYRLYKSSVARTPDFLGLEFWFGELTAERITEDGLAEAFVQSAEFGRQFPQDVDDETFVRSYYTNILEREADPGGLEFWTDQFASGVSRAQLLQAFAISQEFVRLNEDNYDDGVFVLPLGETPGAAPPEEADTMVFELG